MAGKTTPSQKAPVKAKPAVTAKAVVAKKVVVKKAAPVKKPVKASVKTSARTKTSVQSLVLKHQAAFAKVRSVRVRKVYVIGVALLIVLGFSLFYFRGLFVAAIVNGQPISRLSVVNQAEKQAGKQALDQLVRDALIQQEARKENVTVSDKEVDDQIKSIQVNLSKQGQTLDQALAAQGMTKNDLRHLIKLDKLVEKMAGKDVTVTDQEVQDYMDKNQASLPQGQTDEQIKATVKAQLTQQKISQQVQAWLTNLQTKARITYFVQY